MTTPEDRDPDEGGRLEPLRPGQFYRLAWVVYLLLAIGGLIWVGFREGSIPLALFFTWETLALDVGLGLAAAGFLILAWMALRRTTRSARELERELARMLGEVDASEVVALALLSGLAEELFFRGAMQGALGWPIATIAFTLLHSGPGRAFRVWTLFAGIAGLTFAGLVEWRQTLAAAIVAHVVVNAVNLRYLSRQSKIS